MGQTTFLNDLQSWNTGTKVTHTPFGLITDVIRVAEITSTSATTWPLIERSGQGGRADTSQASITVPANSLILQMGIRIPSTTLGGTASGLVATTGNRLKLATAVTVNTFTFAEAAGANAAVASAAASGSTFAPATVTNGYFNNLTTSIPITSSATFELYNDNGTTGAGSGVTVASGRIALVMVRITYISTATDGTGFLVPTAQQAFARPARGTDGITYIPTY